MKTKYIKVPVSERLPEKSGWNICFEEGEQGICLYHFHVNTGFKNGYADDRVTHWLEEVPDREEEMKDLLEEIRDGIVDNGLDRIKELEDFYTTKINRLLNELKQ